MTTSSLTSEKARLRRNLLRITLKDVPGGRIPWKVEWSTRTTSPRPLPPSLPGTGSSRRRARRGRTRRWRSSPSPNRTSVTCSASLSPARESTEESWTCRSEPSHYNPVLEDILLFGCYQYHFRNTVSVQIQLFSFYILPATNTSDRNGNEIQLWIVHMFLLS